MDKKDGSIIKKFEVDEKTSELKIVELSETEYLKEQEKPAPNKNIEEKKKQTSIGKQMIMNQVLGFDVQNTTDKKQRIFKTLISVIFIIFVVGVLAWTAINDFASGEPLPSWEQISDTLSANWFYILIAMFCLFMCYLLKGCKLSVMCKALTKRWHFRTCFQTGIVGVYYNNVTPLAVGGQPFEIHYLSKHGVHGGVAASLPIATFFLNQVAFVIIGIVALSLFAGNTLGIPSEMLGAIPQITAIIACVGLVLCLFMPTLVIIFSFTPRLGAVLVRFVTNLGAKLKIIKNPELFKYKTLKNVIHNSRCLKKVAKKPGVFILMILISFGEQLANASIAYFTLRFFGFNWPAPHVQEWSQVIQLCMILYAGISFIPTPGNSGAADLSFYLLFKTGLGINHTDAKFNGFAFPAMIMWRLLSFYATIIIGFIFTTIRKKRDKKLEKLKQKNG